MRSQFMRQHPGQRNCLEDSAGIAVNAIMQLYSALGHNNALQLSGQTLMYTISHDNERVKIYGHFATLQGKLDFYRYLIGSFIFNFEPSQGRTTTPDFRRAIYDTVYLLHWKRIQSALAKMEDPRARSVTSNLSLVEIDCQELDASATSSQEAFKVRRALASKQQKGEMALLRELMAQQERRRHRCQCYHATRLSSTAQWRPSSSTTTSKTAGIPRYSEPSLPPETLILLLPSQRPIPVSISTPPSPWRRAIWHDGIRLPSAGWSKPPKPSMG